MTLWIKKTKNYIAKEIRKTNGVHTHITKSKFVNMKQNSLRRINIITLTIQTNHTKNTPAAPRYLPPTHPPNSPLSLPPLPSSITIP